MARPVGTSDDQVTEEWLITTPSTVYVSTYDRRDDRYVQTMVSGTQGARKLRITRQDRVYNQERIPEENIHLDPFLNGQLRRVDKGPVDETLDVRNHLDTADLQELLKLTDKGVFAETVADISSELVLRRLLALAEDEGTAWQLEALRDSLKERYPIGGAQRTVREMHEEERRQRIGIN